MSLPFLSVYTLSKEAKERLQTDAGYTQQAFEALLGPSNPKQKNTAGWISFNCPSGTCAGKDDYKLGVCFSPGAFGAFRCLRCDLKGRGFSSLCRILYKDPGEYVSNTTTYRAPPPQKKAIEVREHPLAANEFNKFWKWAADSAKKEYGDTGLLATHQQNLEKRSLEIEKLPFYFSMPPADYLRRGLQRYGENICDKAGVWDRETQKRRLFFEEGRMALVYPVVPWLNRTLPFGYLRSYNPGAKTERDKKFKLLGALGYHSSHNCYVRVDMEAEPQPLLIGEAEIKIEAAWQAGTNGIGRPGINSAHDEVARIIVRMLELSNGLNPTRIILCDDTEADERHQGYVELNIHILARTIRDTVLEQYNGYVIPIHRVCLPANPGHKCDIDDFISSLVERHGLDVGRRKWTEWLYTEVKKTGLFKIRNKSRS